MTIREQHDGESERHEKMSTTKEISPSQGERTEADLSRLAKLAGRVLRSNLRELAMPYRMTMILTYRCQLRCAMCGISKREPGDELSAAEIALFLKRSPGLSWINLSGGEIFLRTDLTEIVNAIHDNCPDLYLLNFPTNGYETETIVRTLTPIIGRPRSPRLMVTVSVDGPPAIHDRIRGVSGSWERAVETYRHLRQLQGPRFRVSLGMTLQQANSGAFEETVRAVNERIGTVHYRDFHVNVAHRSEHYYVNIDRNVFGDQEQILAQMKVIRRLRQEPLLDPVAYLERHYQQGAESFLRTGLTPLPCQALGASFFVDPAGMVYPCTIYDRPLANIRDHAFRLAILWHSAQRTTLRQEIRAGKCPQCWTPCEAYQSILANLAPWRRRRSP